MQLFSANWHLLVDGVWSKFLGYSVLNERTKTMVILKKIQQILRVVKWEECYLIINFFRFWSVLQINFLFSGCANKGQCGISGSLLHIIYSGL